MYGTINVTTDIICIVFSLMVFLYLRINSERKEPLNRLLSWVALFNIGMLLGDIPNWVFEGFGRPWYPAALQCGTFLLYLSGRLIPWAYSLYICTYLSTKAKLKPWIFPVIHSLFGVDLVLLFLSLTNNMYYYFSAQNIYYRGEIYWLSQLIPLLLLLLDAGIILHYRRILRLKGTIAFLSYILLPIIGMLVQFWIYGISTTYFTSTVSLYIIFFCVQSDQRLLAERQKGELEKAKVLVMLSQIQPHFLYNALSVIKGLCHTDPLRAEKAVDYFSDFLRGNIDSLSAVMPIPFEQELRHTQHYLELERMRFGTRLNTVYELPVTLFRLPCLTLQPIVENAVRYGITKRREGGTVTISTEETDSAYRITVLDDGIGFSSEQPKQDGRTHIGISNVRERLRVQCGGTLEISSTEGCGTTAVITIPKEERKHELLFGG